MLQIAASDRQVAMAVDDRARQALHRRLEQVLGDEHAATLMAHLPPMGWADVATGHDLEALDKRVGQRFDTVDQRFDAVDQRFDAVDQRFDAVDQRLDAVDQRFDALEQRFDALEQRLAQRFEAIDERFDAVNERIDLKSEALEHRVLSTFHRELVTQTRLFVFAMVGSLATIASLAFAAARLG